MSNINLYESLSYNGQNYSLIKNNTIGFLSGASFCIWDIEQNERKYIWSQKTGFQSFASNFKKQILVLVEYGLNPNLYVYNTQTLKLISTIPNCTKMDIISLDLSRDGTKLLMVQGCPEFQITVWDLEKKQRLQGKNSVLKLNQKFKFISASLSTMDNNMFCVLYAQQLYIYEMKSEYSSLDEQIEKTISLKERQYENHNKTDNVSAIWDNLNQLYLAQKDMISIIDTTKMTQIMRKMLTAQPQFLLLTQKHLIISYESALIEWLFRYQEAFVNDEECLPLTQDKFYYFYEGKITKLIYNQKCSEMIIGTSEGSIFTLDIPAETFIEEEEEEGNEKTQKKDATKKEKKIMCDQKKVGPFHRDGIIYIKQLNSVDIVVSLSKTGGLMFWDLQQRNLIANYVIECEVTAANITQDDNTLFIGTSKGCLRAIDISKIYAIKINHIHKLYKKNKPINSIMIHEGFGQIAVSSSESTKLFHLNADLQSKYKIIGYQRLPGQILSSCWNTSLNQNDQPSILCLVNYLLCAIVPPQKDNTYESLCISPSECPLYGRKVDSNLQLIHIHSESGNILATGSDKVLKRYKHPDEFLLDIDFKSKEPPKPPINELDGHDLLTSAFCNSQNHKLVISGGTDGSIIIRDQVSLTNFQKLKVMSSKYNGVTALNLSNCSNLVFVGGDDGSFKIVQLNKPALLKAFDMDNDKYQTENSDELINQDDDQVEHYQKVLADEYNKSQDAVRNQKRLVLSDQLSEIQSALQILLKANKDADELEQLERDEFCIDAELRNKITNKGVDNEQKLRQQTLMKKTEQEILCKKIKSQTWDKMETHLKAINGITSNALLYNFHIESDQNSLRVKKVIELRKIELREKFKREADNQSEIISVENFCKKSENYVINSFPGKPSQFVFNNYEKQDDEKDKKKNVQQADAGAAARKQTVLGKPKAADVTNAVQEGDKEEVVELQMKPVQKRNFEEFTTWDYLYGAMELFTNNRKRNQIYLLKNCITDIKRQFNKEFEQMFNYRSQQLDMINERNKRIIEILNDLQKPIELQQLKKNYLENPESILEVAENEIKFQRYLSKEARQKIEEARLREEERLRLLAEDDAGVRAIKDMMNGTLEEKKENVLEENLEREEWMNKPADEMSDDEKNKLKEYELKLLKMNEEKEKYKKNLENELKKLKSEITDICQKFDEKFMILFRRRLEYEYRICEQHLYITRLSLSMLFQKEAISQKQDLQIQIEKLRQQEDEYQFQLQSLEEFKQFQRSQLDQVIKDFTNIFQHPDTSKIKNIYAYAFEECKKDEKKKQDEEEFILGQQQYSNLLQPLDLYFDQEILDLKKLRDMEFQNYVPDIDEKISNLQLIQPEDTSAYQFIIQTLQDKFKLKLQMDKQEKDFEDLQFYIQNFEQTYNEFKNEFQKKTSTLENVSNFLETSQSNIEIQLRQKQGQVEVPSIKPVISYNDAILVLRDVIEKLNHKIQNQGNLKIKSMDKIRSIGLEVATAEYNSKKRDLSIIHLELQTKIVQMLRVKKEMHVALTKNEPKVNEVELKNINEQIEKIRQTTDKRIMIYKHKEEKIKKDIDFILKENDQLLTQGSNLNATVKQRKEISEMMFKKNQVQGGEEAQPGDESYEKFKQISFNRKLFDLAKRQTEEIELLREELNRLKSKTFANFSKINNK